MCETFWEEKTSISTPCLCHWGWIDETLPRRSNLMSSPVKCSGVIRVKGGQRWSEWQSILLCSCPKVLGAAEAPLPSVLIYRLLRLFVLLLGCWQLYKLR